MTKSIGICGGAGFIGLHTAVVIHEAGYKPVIMDNFSNAEKHMIARFEKVTGTAACLYEGNCCDADFMTSVFAKEKDIAGVIHFAAWKAVGESVEKPLAYYQNNLMSLMTLIQVMHQAGVSNLVFSSSATVYGDPDESPLTEETRRKPAISPYGNSKMISEDILRDCAAANLPLKVFALRYFNPIGAHPSGLIGELPLGVPANLVPYVTQTAAGIRSELTVFGNDYPTPDGTCVRDYIHVMDLAVSHLNALEYLEKNTETAYYDAVNIGTGRGSSVLEVIERFKEVTGVALPYKIGPRRPGDAASVYADVRKAQDVIGWTAQYDLKDALRDAWSWQQQLEREKPGEEGA